MTDHRGAASPRTEAGKGLLAAWKRDPKELWTVDQVTAAIIAIEAEAVQEAPSPEGLHRHRYGLIPIWREDGSAVDSWWWCTDHPAGEWVRIEDDPDAAEAIPRAAQAPAPEGLRAAIEAFLDAREAYIAYRGGTDQDYIEMLDRRLNETETALRKAIVSEEATR